MTSQQHIDPHSLMIDGLVVASQTHPVRYPVRGVSLSLSPGQRCALVGESGSGKSLTALAVMGLLPPPMRVVAGRVELDGRRLTGLSSEELAKLRGGSISMIYQNPLTALNPTMTVGQQIAEALQLHVQRDRRKARLEAVEWMERVGIEAAAKRASAYPHEFSGGMRQRIVVAMALCTRPRVVIADEPTTALDVTTQARILRLLDQLTRETGTALLLITHNIAIAAQLCDSVAVMYAGRIVEYGNNSDFFHHQRHPYSEGLLESLIGLETDRTTPVAEIGGTPPGPLTALTPLCAFLPRCRRAIETCRDLPPQPLEIGDDHVVECHLIAGSRDAGAPCGI